MKEENKESLKVEIFDLLVKQDELRRQFDQIERIKQEKLQKLQQLKKSE